MRKPASIAFVIFFCLSPVFPGRAYKHVQDMSYLQMPPDTNVVLLPNLEVKTDASNKKLSSSTPFHEIDWEKIKNAGVTDISDAMRRLPGVNLKDYGGAGGMKTVSVRGLGSEHTSVFYDGVALSECQSGQIDLSRYSLDNISSISLYSNDNSDIFMPAKGAASASSIYISSFTIPDSIDLSPHFRAQLRIGAFGFYNPFVRMSKSYANGFSFSANADFIHSKNDYPFTLRNGAFTTREKRENSEMDSWHGEINGHWKLKDGKTLAAKLYYYDNSRDLPGPVIYYVSKSNEHLRERNWFGQAQFRGRLSSVVSLLAITKFNWSSSRYKDIDGKYPDGRLDNYYIQRESYFSGSLLYTPISGLAVDYSADWAWNNLSSNKFGFIRPCRHSVLQTLSAKLNVWRLSFLARGLFSLYVNDAKDGKAGKNEQRFSPMASISLRPFEDIDFFMRVSYKNIFRLPTFNEAYYDNYGSINLDPEITDQINIGLTYQSSSSGLASNMSATLDGYANNIKNKIMAVPYNMFLWTMTNLGKVRIYGLDATVSSTFSLSSRHSILADGSYSYQRAQIRTSASSSDWMKQLAYVPLNSGSASLSWLNPWVNVAIHTVGCGARYTSNFNLPETKIAGYFDTGISLSREIRAGKSSVGLRLDFLNILDRQYEIVARYPMPGRSWKFSVEYGL